ncbi:MAG: hypothetical protein AB7K68_10455 [Bacteriovoracia bacterium]
MIILVYGFDAMAVCASRSKPAEQRFYISEVEPLRCPCVNSDNAQSILEEQGCLVRAKSWSWLGKVLGQKPTFDQKVLTNRRDICAIKGEGEVTATLDGDCHDVIMDKEIPPCKWPHGGLEPKNMCNFFYRVERMLF